MVHSIEAFLSNVGATALTQGFLIALLIAFVAASVLRRLNKAHAFTQYAPTLLTTLGILGTFAGIISGLLGFDVDDIDNSIGDLLAGLKTAFITSLAGMTLSIGYKLLASTGWINPGSEDELSDDDVGISDLYSVMREQVDGVAQIRNSIGGDTESSLVGQLKLLRSDLRWLSRMLSPKVIQAAC